MKPDGKPTQMAACQGGVILIAQALECGLTQSAVSYRVRTGQWSRIRRGVYRVIDMNDHLSRLKAAVAALPTAVVSHESAADFHGIGDAHSASVAVTVHSSTTHVFPGVTVHRTRDLHDSHVVSIDGLPTTTLARTVIDLAAIVHPLRTESLIDRLVLDRRLTLEQLQSVFVDVAKKGKPGSSVVRELLEARSGEPHPMSKLERLGLKLIREAGLPEPRLEYPIPWDPRRRFDVAYPSSRLVIEWDSRRWHTAADAFERDRSRDRQVVLHGWRLLRFTWDDVTVRPNLVANAIQAALESGD